MKPHTGVQSFVTGRHYKYVDGRPVDQRIEWVLVGDRVFFRDAVRHISGKVDVSNLVRLQVRVRNSDVLAAYDRCQYDHAFHYEIVDALGEEVSQ